MRQLAEQKQQLLFIKSIDFIPASGRGQKKKTEPLIDRAVCSLATRRLPELMHQSVDGLVSELPVVSRVCASSEFVRNGATETSPLGTGTRPLTTPDHS